MEYLTILGGEVWLPFARSRVKALRAAGILYAEQKFDLGDAQVRVSVEPTCERIYIEGGRMSYRISPTSAEHPDGPPPDPTSPNTLVTADASVKRFRKRSTSSEEGTLDWVSYKDATDTSPAKYGEHLITWDGEFLGRYRPPYSEGPTSSGRPYVWVDGVKIFIGVTPNGAAMRRVEMADGTRKVFVIVAVLDSPTSMTINYFSLKEALEIKSASMISAGTFPAPSDADSVSHGLEFKYAQNVFFCGKGEVFATMTAAKRLTEEQVVAREHRSVTDADYRRVQAIEVQGKITFDSNGTGTAEITGTTPFEVGTYTYSPGGSSGSESGDINSGAYSWTFSSSGPSYTSVFTEAVGVDVRPSGEVVQIIHRETSNHISSSSSQGGTGYTSDTNSYSSSYRNGIINKTTITGTVVMGDDVLYSHDYVSPHTVTSGSTTSWTDNEYHLEHRDTSVAGRGELYDVVVHDLDARYGTGTYFLTSFIHEETITYGYRDQVGGDYNTVTTVPGTFNSYVVVRKPDGTEIKKQIQTGVPYADAVQESHGSSVGGLGSFADISTSAVYITDRRLASRRTDSFIASTVPLKDLPLSAPILRERGINVVIERTKERTSVDLSKFLPDDTMISMYPLSPIYK